MTKIGRILHSTMGLSKRPQKIDTLSGAVQTAYRNKDIMVYSDDLLICTGIEPFYKMKARIAKSWQCELSGEKCCLATNFDEWKQSFEELEQNISDRISKINGRNDLLKMVTTNKEVYTNTLRNSTPTEFINANNALEFIKDVYSKIDQKRLNKIWNFLGL